jgi:pantetheine-phosphate adenylyltransferase
MRSAFYAGSFDPVTNGHVDVLRQTFALADRVVVGIGIHPGKVPLFTFEERSELLRAALADRLKDGKTQLEIVTFDGLVIEAARKAGASLMVRGLRDGTDLDYEMQMAGMNGQMAPDLVTVFLPASPSVRPITATLVRQIAKMGGDVSAFVPPAVAQSLKTRYAGSPAV